MSQVPLRDTPVSIIQSWGVASARNTSGCLVHDASSSNSEYIYDVPIGPLVIRWDMTSKKRLMQFQAHSDLVTCTRLSPDGNLIASSSYSGEVKLWSPQWACLDSTQAPMESQHHLAWSCDSKRILVIGNGKDSSVIVYDISTTKQPATMRFKQAWTLCAIDQSKIQQSPNTNEVKDNRCSVTEDIATKSEVGSEISGRNYPYRDAFFMAEFNPSGNIFAVKEIPYQTTLVYLLSPEGVIMKTKDLMATIKDEDSVKRPVNTLFISIYHSGMYAIGVQGGRIVLMDAESLDMIKIFKVGSGFRMCIWDKDDLIVASDSGMIMWWSVASGEKVAEFSSGMQGYAVHMNWSVSGKGLWICGFSYLAFLSVERNDADEIQGLVPSLAIHSYEITCVGVGFDPSGTKLGSGDMVGNVWVTKKENIAPIHKCLVNASVRCLTWRTEEAMIIGTLDGSIHSWKISEPHPSLCLQLDGSSIIHIQFDHKHELLAIGTSKGVLQVIKMGDEATDITTVITMIAHLPQPERAWDQRFGQLGKQAEIWSLCWSPDDSRLATCSEDQTVKIWKTDSWKCITTLTGHTLAVTCVDWIQHGKWSLLVSCSDDRTARLVNGETFELLDVVNTKDIIYGWHTLTYLSFYPYKGSSLLVCTTQNGHLVVWGIDAGEGNGDGGSRCSLRRSWKGKLHLGSVEGLAWQDEVDGGSIATVGADCVVNLFKVL